jgi:hypothetical protein
VKTYSVSFDPASARRVDYFSEASGRAPEKLIADWTLERLATLQIPDVLPDARRHGRPDDVEALRSRYRPDDVWVLMVGESPPAAGSFFYRADSHLFEATREAFELALGPMPPGEAFLNKFQSMGFWLYDVVREPVNRKRGRPRGDAVAAGVPALAALIADLEPDFVVAVKTSLEGFLAQAARMSDFPASRVVVLPFPLYQWKQEYVSQLSRFLTPKLRQTPEIAPEAAASRMTLHEAMSHVLATRGGGPMPARQLANEVAAQGLYLRADGARADYQQLLARTRKYPQLFAVSREGISLRDRPAAHPAGDVS